jgi:hypothetical protein
MRNQRLRLIRLAVALGSIAALVVELGAGHKFGGF